MKRITVTLREDVIDRIQAHANRRGLSFSAAVRCIVMDAQNVGLIPAEKSDDDCSQE